MNRKYVFPFPAVIGQERIKKALILNVINPLIGGVLISGEKGTAKSTLVRGLARLIPHMEVVELPLNVTEDRLIGGIDLEKAVKYGKKSFEPGILKKAHGNLLYADEVNLLSEHIVNSLLEVSAAGANIVEREGISYSHPCRFSLVGTMNPEEGKLRPQFLDRFGLYVEVMGTEDAAERVEIIKRRLEYEKNREEFLKQWEGAACELAGKINRACEAVKKTGVSDNAVKLAAEISGDANCAGHRAELVIVETAKALAAWYSRTHVTLEDIKEAAQLALPHRIRETTQTQSCSREQSADNMDEDQNRSSQEEEDNTDMERQQRDGQNDEQPYENNREDDEECAGGEDGDYGISTGDGAPESIEEPGGVFDVRPLAIETPGIKVRRGSGKRSRVKTSTLQGRYVKYSFPKGGVKDIAFDATFRAAAPYQNSREKDGVAIAICNSDLREKVREKRTGNTILFIVDASGSMGANRRMKAVKGAVLSLLNDAYQKRDRVGMVAFRKDSAELLLGITRSVDMAHKKLRELPTGGRTPLAAGLNMGFEIIKAAKVRDPDMIPVIVLVSDGRSNVSVNGDTPVDASVKAAAKIAAEGVKALVVDTECDFIRLSLAKKIAEAMKADYYKLEELESGRIVSAVNSIFKLSG